MRRHGAVRYRFKYLSSIAPLHDPTAGLAPAWWRPTAFERRGAGGRHRACGSSHVAADGKRGCEVVTHLIVRVACGAHASEKGGRGGAGVDGRGGGWRVVVMGSI